MDFAKVTPAPASKTKNIRGIGMLTAAFFILLAVAQLFTFERFAEVLQLHYAGLGGGVAVSAACIVTLEVAAIPFLLAMPLSKAARVLSMVAGWLAVATWCALSLLSAAGGDGTALLGATVELPGGWWTVCFTVALGVLTAWVSWGMWPLSAKRGMSK